MKIIKFEELVNQNVLFYGVDNNYFKINEYVFEAIEDENDGERSYLQSIEIKNPENLIFFHSALANVFIRPIREKYRFDGYQFVDVDDGHVWLEIGTNNFDDWYPYFVFRYNPKSKAGYSYA